ncbi:Chimeric ERCC6-PGBD3 protein, partial [Geodia barretti]
MKTKCRENYNPHPQNSVDEAMIGYKGRSYMLQYMPMKPTKRGFKVWVRADAVNDYFCDFEVYAGRAVDGDTTTEFGLGERVVLELTECLRGGHYQIYCDNYFSTCRLFD